MLIILYDKVYNIKGTYNDIYSFNDGISSIELKIKDIVPEVFYRNFTTSTQITVVFKDIVFVGEISVILDKIVTSKFPNNTFGCKINADVTYHITMKPNEIQPYIRRLSIKSIYE